MALDQFTKAMLEGASDISRIARAGAIARFPCVENHHGAARTSEGEGGNQSGYARSNNGHIDGGGKVARWFILVRRSPPPIGL